MKVKGIIHVCDIRGGTNKGEYETLNLKVHVQVSEWSIIIDRGGLNYLKHFFFLQRSPPPSEPKYFMPPLSLQRSTSQYFLPLPKHDKL